MSAPTSTDATTTADPTRPAAPSAAAEAHRRLTSPWASLAAIIIAVLWTIPTIGLLISSFRPEEQVKTTGWWTFFTDPQVTLENYRAVLHGDVNLATYFVNTIVITLPAVVIPITLATLAAYAFAWMKFPGRDALFVAVFAMQIVPIQVTMIPLLSLYVDPPFGLPQLAGGDAPGGGFYTIWLSHSIFALPLAIYLLHNFMKEIPAELIEAARVDGAGHVKIFTRIMLPLMRPAIAAFAIFQFLWVWNDLLVALVFGGGSLEVSPLTVRLAELSGTRGNDWQLLSAGAFVSLIVPLVVFLAGAAVLRARSAGRQRQGLMSQPPGRASGSGRGISSIRDVAKAAGVSTGTVSRALRGLDRVSEETRARVLSAAAELHYVPSPTAASLASGKTYVVGVVVPFITRWFFANLIDGAEKQLRDRGYHVLLFNVGRGASSTRTLVLDKSLLWKRLDAVLVLSADLDADELALLSQLRRPVVTVGVDLNGWDRVGIDDRAAAEDVTTYLLSLGHRCISFVGGNPDEDVHVATAVDRLAGFRKAVQAAGLELRPDQVVTSDWTVQGGIAAGELLLSSPDPPTAVVAASDEMAIGVICAARERGVDVPGDLSVVGIDDHEMAFTHGLTTIAQPVREQGEAAAQLVLDALTRTAEPARQVVTMPTQLVVRSSTGPAPHCPAG